MRNKTKDQIFEAAFLLVLALTAGAFFAGLCACKEEPTLYVHSAEALEIYDPPNYVDQLQGGDYWLLYDDCSCWSADIDGAGTDGEMPCEDVLMLVYLQFGLVHGNRAAREIADCKNARLSYYCPLPMRETAGGFKECPR